MSANFLARCYHIDECADPETWATIWSKLTADSINADMYYPQTATCPRTGESWQYMGSYHTPTTTVHEFRHRHHPAVNRRVVKRVILTRYK